MLKYKPRVLYKLLLETLRELGGGGGGGRDWIECNNAKCFITEHSSTRHGHLDTIHVHYMLAIFE